MTRWILVALATLLLLSACSNGTPDTFQAKHIHGFAYTAEGEKLLTATHDGLYAYHGGKWSGPIGEPHDLMGFSLTKKGIYSSGHPAPDSDKPNPLGLIKSTNEGETWKTIDFEGQSDFHQMTAGFQTGTLYVMNEHLNDKMDRGFYVSFNGGESWDSSSLNGVQGNLLTLEAHPTREKEVALGTDFGLFVSRDAGEKVNKIDGGLQATALLFDRNQPDFLWVGGYTKQPILVLYNMQTKQKKTVTLPFEDPEDAVQFIAQNPTNPKEIAIATFKKNIYTSQDGGQTWKSIMKDGESIPTG
ncbi:F510_1955 family glycosylhydrolase [Desmospora profundinema]|uniref:Sortilin N-terminal domain-containing protein n=1 Tax=Desmospora profundinema TaxID=1571184 RepID=A0ABU1II25_9BACL|nr:hypothetical protein [Desmospora profundinema]MDR6224043.1 hypothetical protein [Desmospora profundinema]